MLLGGVVAAALGTRTALLLSGTLAAACRLVLFLPGGQVLAGRTHRHLSLPVAESLRLSQMAGSPGAGKSTLANRICELLPAEVVDASVKAYVRAPGVAVQQRRRASHGRRIGPPPRSRSKNRGGIADVRDLRSSCR
jgi:hypothetical protein